MTINIPCPSCGCQHCYATTKSGESVSISICYCEDGSGEYEVTISNFNSVNPNIEEKHQCPAEDLINCLTSRYNINIDSITNICF